MNSTKNTLQNTIVDKKTKTNVKSPESYNTQNVFSQKVNIKLKK